MKLVDELAAEHERIESVAGAFRTYARRHAAHQAPREDGVRFVEFFRTYAGEFHHAREEDVLFVALRERAELPGDRGPIAAIVEDHRRMAELLDRLAPLVAGNGDHGAEILELALRCTCRGLEREWWNEWEWEEFEDHLPSG